MTNQLPRQGSSSRVLLVSQRNISDQVANAALYEFEDLLCALDHVDLIASNRSPGRPFSPVMRSGIAAQLKEA
jgi:hypothetical protein